MDSFAMPVGKRTLDRVKAGSGAEWRRVAACSASMTVAASVAVAALAGLPDTAHAQDTGGTIMIPGPAETNPAAVVAMAKSAGMNVGGGTASTSNAPMNPAAIAQLAGTARQGGYSAAANAADAAMRAAAQSLDQHAEAADASSASSEENGMIVIPGNGEAKAAAAPKLAMAPSRTQTTPNTAGMIVIPGNGEAKPAAAPISISNRATPSPRDVVPVVVSSEGEAAPIPTQVRVFQARPIAAATPLPVGGMMPVSMRASAPLRPVIQPSIAIAANASALPTQDGESVRTVALAYLTQQAAGLPGKPEISVAPVFPHGLALCDTLEPFMPNGTRLWGRTTVGVRCSGAHPWTLYLQAKVSVQATYYTAARAAAPGEVLTAADLVPREGDITMMPLAIVTDPSQAVGAVTLTRLAAGLPLRTDMLRGAGAISIGQTVHVVTGGDGFSISAEGSAMNNATPGQQIHVKTAGGQIISGIAKDASTVEVPL